MWETQVRSLGHKDPLEKGMATHSSILAWKIPRTKKPGGLQFMGSQRVRHDWATNTDTHTQLLGCASFFSIDVMKHSTEVLLRNQVQTYLLLSFPVPGPKFLFSIGPTSKAQGDLTHKNTWPKPAYKSSLLWPAPATPRTQLIPEITQELRQRRKVQCRAMKIILDFLLLLLIIIYSYLESLVKVFIPRKRKSVAGEIVLITGAGHGIGRQTAYEFAKRKSRLVLWDINKVLDSFAYLSELPARQGQYKWDGCL